jgi:hypothetical protein
MEIYKNNEQWTWLSTGTGQLGQDSRDKTDESGQDILDRSTRPGHLGPVNWDRTAQTGQVGLIGNLDRTART